MLLDIIKKLEVVYFIQLSELFFITILYIMSESETLNLNKLYSTSTSKIYKFGFGGSPFSIPIELKQQLISQISSSVRKESKVFYAIEGNNANESFGEDVSITVLGVKGNQVRIGINAPKDVAVHREEIYNRIQGEMESDSD